MSWEAWHKNLQAHSGNRLNSSGIYTHDGNTCHASDDFKVTPAEVKELVSCIKAVKQNGMSAMKTRASVAGTSYMVLRVEGDEVVLKHEKTVVSAIVVPSPEVVLIGLTRDDANSGVCRGAIFKVSEQLQGRN